MMMTGYIEVRVSVLRPIDLSLRRLLSGLGCLPQNSSQAQAQYEQHANPKSLPMSEKEEKLTN